MAIKKITFLCAFLMASSFVSMNAQASRHITTVIVFDVHGVLANFNKTTLAATLGGFCLPIVAGYALRGVKGALFGCIPAVMLGAWGCHLGARFGLHCLMHKGRKPHVEHDIYGDTIMGTLGRNIFLHFANMYTPNTEVFALVSELKSAGHHVIIGSNIGTHALNALKKSSPACFADTNGTDVFEGYFHPNETNNWINKSDPRFFDQMIAYIKELWPETQRVIFIDDKQKNIAKAQLSGQQNNCAVHGIVFSNAQSLRSALHDQSLLKIQ